MPNVSDISTSVARVLLDLPSSHIQQPFYILYDLSGLLPFYALPRLQLLE